VNEFEKAGFTPLPSERVKPFRVAESPVHMECVVDDILPLGEKGGAGNLIVCRIVLMHIDENILTEKGRIDPHKIDLVGRMGRFWYARASGDAVHEIVQEVGAVDSLGFDRLPHGIRHSPVITGNNLARLAALRALPETTDAEALLLSNPRVQALLNAPDPRIALHRYAQDALENGEVELGAQLAVLAERHS
jgi:hypothetical protein